MPIEANGTWTAWQNANITSIFEMFRYGNTVTNNLFGPMTLGMIFIVLTVAQRNRPLKDSLPVSAFITTIAAVLMKLMGMIGDEFVIAMIAVTAVSMIYSFTGE